MPLIVSFIIPAHNEARFIRATVEAIQQAVGSCGLEVGPTEIIVVDDDSSDDTAGIAEGMGARIVRGRWRQIAAVRNAGAKAARGDLFIFIDADTLITPETLQATLHNVRHENAIGGGATIAMDRALGLAYHLMASLVNFQWRIANLAYGCYVYATREAFESVGGFDERYYAAEEYFISIALTDYATRTHRRFMVVNQPVITSTRKMDQFSPGETLWRFLLMMLKGPRGVMQREGLDLWYEPGIEDTPKEMIK